jgi:hypothetical protein
LRQGKEETLFWRKPVQRFAPGRILRQRALQRLVGDAQPAQIGDVFPSVSFPFTWRTGSTS